MPHTPRLPLAIVASIWLAAAPTRVAEAQTSSAAAHAAPTPACSRTWVGNELEIERFLAAGRIVKMEAVPIGVTKPKRANLEPGGPAARFAWKALPPQRRNGFAESYKSEIAAYALDRLLELHMVPPVAERTVDGLVGAAVLWIEGTKGWDMKNPVQGPEPEWTRQISRMKLFDLLIGNIDRNQGNLLYDDDWHLFLIDHSRAFTTRTSLGGIAPLSTVDAALWTRIDALTPESLATAVDGWLNDAEQRAVLARRDRMRQAIAKLVKEKGEARVFLR